MKTKKMLQKMFALLLVLTMTLSMGVTAFAAQEGSLTGGSITIGNAATGESYDIYQLAYIESYDNATGDFAYKVNSSWEAWLRTQTSYVTVDGQGYIEWVEGADESAFAAAAKAQAVSMTADDTADAEAGSVTFDNLLLGWYLVDTSLGSICSLDTTVPNVNIYEKNSIPSISKSVLEDSTGAYGDSATIDVTDTIYYRLTVNTGENDYASGTGVDSNYVITDTLPEGLTYTDGSLSITGWTLDTDYSVTYKDNVLTITLFADGMLSTIGQNTDIVIDYSATAANGVGLGTDLVNNVILIYKEQESENSATVNTFEIFGEDLTKVDGEDNSPLEGVTFVLRNSTTGRYATFNADHYLIGWVENIEDATPLVTDTQGHIYANGLDADTYILEETATLPGYNMLADTVTIVVAEDGSVTYQNTSEVNDDNELTNPSETIIIENNSGVKLPSTGGMGTTMLYIAGAALVIGSGIVLVVRRRMRAE